MKTPRKRGRAVCVDVDRRDVALAFKRYFPNPLFLRSDSTPAHAGRA